MDGLCRLLTGLGREDAGEMRGWMRLYRWAKMRDGVDLGYDNGLILVYLGLFTQYELETADLCPGE